jgi:hypothetical protein
MARNLAQRVHNVSDRTVVVRRSAPELGLSVKRPGEMTGLRQTTIGYFGKPWE